MDNLGKDVRKGVAFMNYKRNEGFRYVFGEPIEATFVIMQNGRYLEMKDNLHPCRIIDISPKGMKIYSTIDLDPLFNDLLSLEINFVLDVTLLSGIGKIVWSKPYGRGKYYGISLSDENSIEEMIISEMKRRRKKEVEREKRAIKVV